MTENFSERIENALNYIQKIQLLFRQRYGEECLADKEIEEVLEIAKAEHEEIQQYRAIGTVEECREARERQIPQKHKKFILVSRLHTINALAVMDCCISTKISVEGADKLLIGLNRLFGERS